MHCIRLIPALCVAMAWSTVTCGAAEPVRYPLFNGQSLDGWHATDCKVGVEDGVLVLQEGNGFVRTNHRYRDFVLELQWRARKASDFDAPAERHVAREAGQWNSLEIDCRGASYLITHNGVVIVRADAGSYPELAGRRGKGFLGLQNHSEEVWYRNVRLGPSLQPESAGRVPEITGEKPQVRSEPASAEEKKPAGDEPQPKKKGKRQRKRAASPPQAAPGQPASAAAESVQPDAGAPSEGRAQP